MVERKKSDKPAAYGFGTTGLVLAAIMEFFMAISVATVNGHGAGFILAFSFVVALLIAPAWLIIGVVCLIKSGKAPRGYRAKLVVLGILNIINIVMAAFFVVLGGFAIVVWILYWGLVLAWFKRDNNATGKGTRKNKKLELTRDQVAYRTFVIMVLAVVAIVLLFGLISTVSR